MPTRENYKNLATILMNFLSILMVTVLLRRNLAGLLHSTDAKKPNETNKTVILLQICVEKLQKLQNCCIPLYFH